MSNMLMLSQMGLSIAGSVAGLESRRIDAKMERAVQAYRNTMQAINTAQQKNMVTLNEIAVQDASSRMEHDIQVQSMRDRGAAEVAAAAAGVKGNSVNLTMRDIASSSATANKNRLDNLKAQYAAYGQERRNIAVGAAMNKDVSVIPRPSVSSMLFGVSTNVLDIWDSHQPPGSKIADRLAR